MPKERERAPEGFFPPLFVALGYVSLFYGCTNFKCIFLPCEMHSFNFPGGKLEGLIDGQMCAHIYVCTHLTIKHTVIQHLLLEGMFSLFCSLLMGSDLSCYIKLLNDFSGTPPHTHVHAHTCTHTHVHTQKEHPNNLQQ